MPCKRLTKTRFWQAKKGLREVTETLNILTTVSLSQQQVHYLMTFVMIMIKVKSRFILISKQITNTLQDLLPARMMQTRKINLETDKNYTERGGIPLDGKRTNLTNYRDKLVRIGEVYNRNEINT